MKIAFDKFMIRNIFWSFNLISFQRIVPNSTNNENYFPESILTFSKQKFLSFMDENLE